MASMTIDRSKGNQVLSVAKDVTSITLTGWPASGQHAVVVLEFNATGVVYTTTSPPPPPPVASTGWPDSSNTGCKGTLTGSGNVTTSANGQIIENRNIGVLTVLHSGVIVRNCRIQYVLANGQGLTVQDCTITGNGTKQQTGVGGEGSAFTVIRCNISGCENGIYAPTGSVIKDNYIHDFASPGNPDPHYDGITQQGDGSNILIEHNSIVGVGLSSCVFVKNDWGPISNVKVNNNRLIGGSYTVYSDAGGGGGGISGVEFTNNRLGGWAYGPLYLDGNSVVWTGNVRDDNGAAIPAP